MFLLSFRRTAFRGVMHNMNTYLPRPCCHKFLSASQHVLLQLECYSSCIQTSYSSSNSNTLEYPNEYVVYAYSRASTRVCILLIYILLATNMYVLCIEQDYAYYELVVAIHTMHSS